jgi:hypothetical protein
MEIERVINEGHMELWAFEWDMSLTPARKANRRFVGYEQPVRSAQDQAAVVREAICWSYGRTLGNITVSNEQLLGSFPASEGDDALLRCDIMGAGKMRNGKERWWCRTHQRHWGTKADIADAATNLIMRCSNHAQQMSYVIDPQHIKIQDHAEVGIWCSMPPALTHKGGPVPRHPKIHVHVRDKPGGVKVIDQDFKALSLHYNARDSLFGNSEITKVHLTPPSGDHQGSPHSSIRAGVRFGAGDGQGNGVHQLQGLRLSAPGSWRVRKEGTFQASVRKLRPRQHMEQRPNRIDATETFA